MSESWGMHDPVESITLHRVISLLAGSGLLLALIIGITMLSGINILELLLSGFILDLCLLGSIALISHHPGVTFQHHPQGALEELFALEGGFHWDIFFTRVSQRSAMYASGPDFNASVSNPRVNALNIVPAAR